MIFFRQICSTTCPEYQWIEKAAPGLALWDDKIVLPLSNPPRCIAGDPQPTAIAPLRRHHDLPLRPRSLISILNAVSHVGPIMLLSGFACADHSWGAQTEPQSFRPPCTCKLMRIEVNVSFLHSRDQSCLRLLLLKAMRVMGCLPSHVSLQVQCLYCFLSLCMWTNCMQGSGLRKDGTG